jgi:predicted permease
MLPVLEVLVPVFAIVALAYWLEPRLRLDLRTISELSIEITSPALIFSVLAGSHPDPARWLSLAGGTAFVAMATGAAGWICARTAGWSARAFLLPVMFWNSGNMGLPMARLALGDAGLEVAALVYVTMATLTSSLGIFIAQGGGSARSALRAPLLWAGILGLTSALAGIELPRMWLEALTILGGAAIPLMLINLGIQLRHLALSDFAGAATAVALRMGGGVACALVYAEWAGLERIERGAFLLQAVMPAAVINVVIAERYGAPTGAVASAIVLGTLVAPFAVPLVLFAIR